MSEMSVDKVETRHPASGSHAHTAATRVDNLKFAMWLYLASEVVIFSVLIAAWLLFRLHNPATLELFHEKIQEWPGVYLVTINTFILLASSWAMVMGLRQIQMGNPAGLMRWIGLTALMGIIFVVLQYVEYSELSHAGIAIFNQGNQFDGMGARFYAPTAFHGAHVIVGALWALYVVNNARRGRYSASNYVGVEVFGLYWHFVDVVWIVLFTVIYLM